MVPDPRGPLAKQVPSTSIVSANEEVKDVLAQGTEPTKRGAYAKFTPAQKAEIGKRAAEHGVVVHRWSGTYAIGVVMWIFLSAKIFSAKLCANPIREKIAPQKFSTVRYLQTNDG